MWGRVEHDLVVFAGFELDFDFVCGPKMTWFLCAHRNGLVFCVEIEIELVFMCGPKLTGCSEGID